MTFPGGCNIVHAQDVARGHVLVAEAGRAGHRYLLGSENLTWETIHEIVADLCDIPGPAATATYTQAYLAATAMELWSRVTGKPPASTRTQAKTLGRYYWYRHARAAELGYAPRSARRAIAGALHWLLASEHVSGECGLDPISCAHRAR
jgi:dihydroflavonol-4-reductase